MYTSHHSWTSLCPSQLDNKCPSLLDNASAHHSCTRTAVCPAAHHQPFPKSQGTFGGCHPCAQHMYGCSGCPSLAEPSPGSGEIRTGGWLGSGSLSHRAALSPGAAGSSLNAAFKRQRGLHCDAFIFTKRKLFSPMGRRGADPVGCRGRRGQGTRVYRGQSRPTGAGAVQGTQHPMRPTSSYCGDPHSLPVFPSHILTRPLLRGATEPGQAMLHQPDPFGAVSAPRVPHGALLCRGSQ